MSRVAFSAPFNVSFRYCSSTVNTFRRFFSSLLCNSPISTGSRYYPEVDIILSTVVVTIGSPSDTDLKFNIKIDDTTTVNQITLLAGEFRLITNFSSSQQFLNLSPTNYITVDILQGGGANLTLKFNYTRA
jgi:hypothetical protein